MNAFISDQIGYIFSDALSDVVSTTTGFTFDVTSDDLDAGFDEMTGFISLNGENHGILFISTKEDTMRVLCSYMTGTALRDVSKDDVEDSLCEFVNMTAGNAKLRFNDTGHVFMLSPPFVFRGNDMSIISKKRVNVISKTLSNDEISIKLKVVFY